MSDSHRDKYHLVVNGVRIAIRDWRASKNLPSCLLIHGLADGSFVWEDFAQRLADRFRVIAVDLRGHGDSDPDPTGNYSLDVLSNDIADVVSKMQLEECLMIGHSLGAEIALRMAISPLVKPKAFIFVDAGPDADVETNRYLREQLLAGYHSYPSIESYSSWLSKSRPLLRREVCDRLARCGLQKKADGAFWPRFDPNVVDLLQYPNAEGFWWSTLGTIIQPTLVVRGSGSAVLSPTTCKKITNALPHGSQVTIPLAGHSVMSDNPDDFFAAVMRFISIVFPA